VIDLDEHVLHAVDIFFFCIPREETKPGVRDLQLELPAELRGLWRLYVDRARIILLANERSTKLLIAQGGAPMSDSAIYAIVVSRSEEVLGTRHNPHQARKALATDHGRWSGGDYLSPSAVLDSSPLTLQRHYVDLLAVQRIAEFDAATADDWRRAKGGDAA